ncbi:multiheme c-type cytochrome [Vulgatibacter sp.]|uniref:multiheme c-type cytochrome n=1 Tax=Vulgatibacter sp. TaxID=1971226 RepID=UPI0035691978
MRPRTAILAGLAGALSLACVSKSEAPARAEGKPEAEQATVIFTADIWGQLEPCGCSADMLGGLDRAATWVRQQRAEGPTLLVDAGDAFFDATEYEERDEPQARRRAEAVAQALVSMGVDAKARFERDTVFPVEAMPAQKLLGGPRVLEAGGVRLGLVPVDALHGAGAPAALAAGVAQARKQGAEVVAALIHAPRQQVLGLSGAAKQAGADFVVGSHIDRIADGEEARMVQAELPVFFTMARGQSLLAIELLLRGEGPLQIAGNPAEREKEIAGFGERIRSYESRIAALPPDADRAPFEMKIRELRERRRALAEEKVQPPATGSYLAWQFVPVTEDRAGDHAVKEILASYDRDVAAANLAYAQAHPRACPEPAQGEAVYVGGEACVGCHAAAQAFWKGTGHAHAFETLETIGKQYDLNCISCHVTGWERPGGACDVARVEGRKDVTCESCHGPGSLHAAAPTQVKLPAQVGEQTCKSCHTPENSTAFDYGTYLQKIVGPGHGEKAK